MEDSNSEKKGSQSLVDSKANKKLTSHIFTTFSHKSEPIFWPYTTNKLNILDYLFLNDDLKVNFSPFSWCSINNYMIL